MPNPNALVSNVIRLDPPLDRSPAEMLRAEGGLSVELEGGRRVAWIRLILARSALHRYWTA